MYSSQHRLRIKERRNVSLFLDLKLLRTAPEGSAEAALLIWPAAKGS